MSDRRVADTTVAGSGELVEALLHVFHPLLMCLADALINSTAVTPPEVAAMCGVADGEPRRTISFSLEGKAGANMAAAPTPMAHHAAGAQPIEAVARPTASEGAGRGFPLLVPASARGSSPPSTEATPAFSSVKAEEAGSCASSGGNVRRTTTRRLPTALEKDALTTRRATFDVEHRGSGSDVDSDAPKTVTALPCLSVQTETVAASPLPPTLSPLNSTLPSSTSMSASSGEAPATTVRKRGRPLLTCTGATCAEKEAAAQKREEPLPGVATLPPHAARPFCFTLPNAVLWETVAALAEAVLIDGVCFSWLQGEVQKRAEAQQQRSEEQRGPKATSPLPSPAHVLADALLCFDRPAVAIAHMRWRELTVQSKGEVSPRGSGDHEPGERSNTDTGVFGALPAEMQDAVFTSVSAALMRAAAVHTAQLLSPLCTATPVEARLAKQGETASQRRDVATSAQSPEDSQSFIVLSPATTHAAFFDGSAAASPHMQTKFDSGMAPASFPRQPWPQRGWAAEAQRPAHVAGGPVTFRMVQEKLKHHNRRTLQTQHQQPRPASMSAAMSSSSTSVFPASAPAAAAAAVSALPASGPRGDTSLAAVTASAPSATAVAGQPPSCVTGALFERLLQQAEAQDDSCFYVQINACHCGGATRTEATATPIADAAVRSSAFTVQVLCSALAFAMTDEAAAATLLYNVGPETVHLAGAAASGSCGISACACGEKNGQSSEGGNSYCVAGDACRRLLRQWCVGLEQLVSTTSSMSMWSCTSRSTAQRPKQSSFTTSAAALFAYLRDSSVNPQLELLADYVLETGKTTSASLRIPPRVARDAHGGYVPEADAGAAATANTAVHQLPWTTARWSVRPVVGVREVDYAAHLLTGSREHHRDHGQCVTALPLLPTESVADIHPPTRSTTSSPIDAESPREEPLKRPKIHADQTASTLPRLPPAVEWLRLSDAHCHPSESDQAEDRRSTPPVTQVVERSTAALFQRVLAPTIAAEEGGVCASADVVNPLEEVGAVLATLDAACAGRTLVDASAWRYGRNRMTVAAVSIIGLTLSESDSGGSDAQGSDDDVRKVGGSLPRTHDLPQGPTAERAALRSAEGGRLVSPVRACRARLPLGLYHHECGVLHVADGATYALEMD
nr:unnamed protein product [Leishmania braziliensis]